MEINKIYCEDCLEGMKEIDTESVDMILCDLPYGTTHNKWDSVIDLNKLWIQYLRIIKNHGAMVFTGQSLFSAKLIISNEKYYRYSLIWEKPIAGGFLNARRMPLQAHEDIVIFYKKLPLYNPQMSQGNSYTRRYIENYDGNNYGTFERTGVISINKGCRFPRSILHFKNVDRFHILHPTQKPLELFEYLINTYTREGDLVLDNCMGSGTTAIACINTHRNFIGFENDLKYYEICLKRMEENQRDR